MARLSLPDTVDLYTSGGSPTLVKPNVSGYFDAMTPAARLRFQDVSQNGLAVLWLDAALAGTLTDGMQVYWRERATWWTVRGTPEAFDAPGFAHIEAMVAANKSDGFFAPAGTVTPLMTQFNSASSITAVKVELAVTPDFSNVALSALSSASQAGWVYVSGGAWVAIPGSGLPSAATQVVAYLPTGLTPWQFYYVRWTPYAGGTPLTAQLGVVRA